MAIKYEIHYLPNAGGNEETRRFAHIFEQTAMTDKEMISRIARHSCLGEGEGSFGSRDRRATEYICETT